MYTHVQVYASVQRNLWFIRMGRTKLISSSTGTFLADAGKIEWHPCVVAELWIM